MNKDLEQAETMEELEQAAVIPEAPAVSRKKTAKELKQEEKERIQRHRMEKRMEKEAAKNSRPVRRIGTLTMGVALILTGCFILYWLFNPTVIPSFLIYFGPVILIMLGGEILYNYFRYQDARFKYDIFSSIICFLLICGCAGVTVLPIAYEHFGPERQVTEARLEQEIYNVCYEKLQANNDIASLYVNVYLGEVAYDKTMTISDIAASDYVDIRVRMKNQFQSKEQFATACKKVMDTINGAGVSYRYVHFETAGEGIYALGFSSEKFSQRLSIEELAQQVEVDETAASN
ncbi:MAG: hypothetical protein HFI72_01470 [Peptococcaceae bacterium]|nr:hypothetical protein [Peptococcaceae bacterium]